MIGVLSLGRCGCASTSARAPGAELVARVERIGDVVATTPVSALTADKWNLQRGARYRVVVQFVMWDAAEAMTTLQDLGFTEIKGYRDASELPPDWPVSYDDPHKDSTPTLDTIIIRGEALWPKDDKQINRRFPLSSGTAIVLKAWRMGTAPDPKPNPLPDPNPDPKPPEPSPPTPPAPSPYDPTLAVAIGSSVLAGLVAAAWYFWKR